MMLLMIQLIGYMTFSLLIQMKMIINKSKIAMPDLEDPGFATKIIRKNLDATDGLLKINIYYNK